MRGYGIPPDVDTYTHLLMLIAASLRHGRASLRDAEEVVLAIEAPGSPLEMHALSYGSWLQVVTEAIGAEGGGATWRDGEAIVEIEMRRGIRPDFVQFVTLMSAVARQAELGIPSQREPGVYVFDPLADARGVLALMDKV
jgi:hypothetical protein